MKPYSLVISLALILLSLNGCGSQPNSQNAAIVNTTAANTTEETEEKLWVTAERLDRHTCASENCGVVGQLMYREAVTPLEQTGEWVRISKNYDAACENGKSKYVEKGNAACQKPNGIINGELAEWVRRDKLSETRPADPALTASVDEALVAQSDDFQKHRKVFAKLAGDLIADGRCTEDDFKEMGGWLKSVNEYRDKPVYFTYCGGMTVTNRIYIDVNKGIVIP